MRTLRVRTLLLTRSPSRTCSSRHNSLAEGTGIEINSWRLMVTPARSAGTLSLPRFSNQRFTPTSHSAMAWRAEVFPELLGPMNTTRSLRSIVTSEKVLKFFMVNPVSIYTFFLPAPHLLPKRLSAPLCGYPDPTIEQESTADIRAQRQYA